jgi:hypothetical protein
MTVTHVAHGVFPGALVLAAVVVVTLVVVLAVRLWHR